MGENPENHRPDKQLDTGYIKKNFYNSIKTLTTQLKHR